MQHFGCNSPPMLEIFCGQTDFTAWRHDYMESHMTNAAFINNHSFAWVRQHYTIIGTHVPQKRRNAADD